MCFAWYWSETSKSWADGFSPWWRFGTNAYNKKCKEIDETPFSFGETVKVTIFNPKEPQQSRQMKDAPLKGIEKSKEAEIDPLPFPPPVEKTDNFCFFRLYPFN